MGWERGGRGCLSRRVARARFFLFLFRFALARPGIGAGESSHMDGLHALIARLGSAPLTISHGGKALRRLPAAPLRPFVGR